jgi:hypothetical protein
MCIIIKNVCVYRLRGRSTLPVPLNDRNPVVLLSGADASMGARADGASSSSSSLLSPLVSTPPSLSSPLLSSLSGTCVNTPPINTVLVPVDDEARDTEREPTTADDDDDDEAARGGTGLPLNVLPTPLNERDATLLDVVDDDVAVPPLVWRALALSLSSCAAMLSPPAFCRLAAGAGAGST